MQPTRKRIARLLCLALFLAAVACGTLESTSAPAGDEAGAAADAASEDDSTAPADDAGGDADGPCVLGDGGAGVRCAGACVDPLRDRASCGGCGKACSAAAACEGTCVDVAVSLVARRYEMRCTNDASPCSLAAASPPDESVTLGGTPGTTYAIEVRIRGIVEQRSYPGATPGVATGTNASFFAQGGSESAGDTWNIYDLGISSPASTWHLNNGASGNTYVDAVDYVATMSAKAGATLTLHADSIDVAMAKNRDPAGAPVLVPDIPPYPFAFAGQFLQLDPVSVVVASP